MSACLSGLLTEMNGADLVACGILALIALWLALWALVTWAPVAWQWVKVCASRARSALTRWHVAQIRRVNAQIKFEDHFDDLDLAPLLVILPLVALVVAIMRCQGVGR